MNIMRWGVLMSAVAVALVIPTHGATRPVLEKMTPNGERLHVTFDVGAVNACTVFQEQVVREDMRENFSDGKYAPRHCWLLTGRETGYDEDWNFIDRVTPPSQWLVKADVQYLVPGQAEAMTLTSNTLQVQR